MAKIQLVVEIEERYYEIIKNDVERGMDYMPCVLIANGTPLPKGHGDLIDKSKIYKAIPAEEDNCTGMGMSLDERDGYNEGIDVMYSLVQDEPTIIEADKEG